MPFTFKISVRLALMKASGALALALVCATCEVPGRRVSGPDLVQVVTSPSAVTLDPYQSQQFRAFGRTQTGDSVAVDVQWNASGGSITANGVYSADTVFGDYQVTATAVGAVLTASSQVKNRGPIVQIIVMPATSGDPGGIGELGVAPAMAAVACAYARATGTLPTTFPINHDRADLGFVPLPTTPSIPASPTTGLD